MKATSLSMVLLPLLFAVPAAADSHRAPRHHKAARGPTAMHLSTVHSKTTSAPAQVEIPPAVRRGEHDKKHARHHEHAKPKPLCMHQPVTVMRGLEQSHFALTKCDGTPLPAAVDELSILARPGSAVKPSTPVAQLVKVRGPMVSAGIKRVDPGLLERLQLVADHFGGGRPVTMEVVSGYRPRSVGSFHATGQALDFRVEGVRNEALVAFCKTLQDTGCGYYPNSTFVHMDVRSTGTGHVAWIDASGPGEAAHYVSAWPPPQEPPKDGFVQRMAKILPQLPVDEHPATAEQLGASAGDSLARAN